MKDNSPFKSIARKIHMKKGAISREEIIASYMKEVKKDLMRNLDIENTSDVSMTSVGHTTDNEEECFGRRAQSNQSNEDFDIEEYLQKFK